jgi:hypothetical protein
LLRDQPGLKAKTLFQWLQREHPGKFQDGQLRTLQRHVKQWLALHGPSREVFFPQQHEPGVLASSDFTHMDELQVTIDRQPFAHMLYHFVREKIQSRSGSRPSGCHGGQGPEGKSSSHLGGGQGRRRRGVSPTLSWWRRNAAGGTIV